MITKPSVFIGEFSITPAEDVDWYFFPLWDGEVVMFIDLWFMRVALDQGLKYRRYLGVVEK